MTADVSILIPAYNAEEWIGQAIDSALAQRNVNVEVVVIDDGSTDGTVDVIRRYGGDIIWEAAANRGAPAARNRALALSSAPWVQYLDADDYLELGKVAGQLAVLRRHPEADVLYGPVTIEWYSRVGVERKLEEITEPHDPWVLLARWYLPQTGSPLWRRAALMDVGGWREDQPCCQEHELYLRLLLANKRFVYHPEGGAVYRRFEHGTLSTKNPPLVRTERAKIEARMEQFLLESGAMTPERQWAIDQARFEMARSAWPQDRREARDLHSAIVSRPFRPGGTAAPRGYRLAYGLLGFEAAERLANVRRALLNRSLNGVLNERN